VFDKDRSGYASSSEIKAVMANLGVNFTDDEMQEMMIEVMFFFFYTQPFYEHNCYNGYPKLTKYCFDPM
jgi:hypothetical protein